MSNRFGDKRTKARRVAIKFLSNFFNDLDRAVSVVNFDKKLKPFDCSIYELENRKHLLLCSLPESLTSINFDVLVHNIAVHLTTGECIQLYNKQPRIYQPYPGYYY